MADQDAARTAWLLVRQDDNGHRFVVGEFTSRAAAVARRDELEGTDYQHKQTYWIEPDATGTDPRDH